MPGPRRKPLIAALLAVLLGAATYLASTEGVAVLRRSEPLASVEAGHVPEFVYEPTDTVPTTADYGPVGPVSLVFAVPDVRVGLLGWMDNAWVAVSSQDGGYRAISAPHRPAPAPDAVAVSPDGTTLAWAYDEGVVVYDAVTDEAREVTAGLGADPAVGQFSPDGRRLTVYDGSLRVLEVDTGEVAGPLEGVGEEAARRAVWHPDGSALTYLEEGRLVRHDWQSGDRVETSTTIDPTAVVAWHPSGEQLAATREVRGVKEVEVYDVGRDGRLTLGHTVSPDGYAQQELMGWASDISVAVTALRLETSSLELAFSMRADGTSPPTQLMQLPDEPISNDSIEVASGPLAGGSVDFDEPRWPASDLAKLVGSIILTVFAFGLYITRRPRR